MIRHQVVASCRSVAETRPAVRRFVARAVWASLLGGVFTAGSAWAQAQQVIDVSSRIGARPGQPSFAWTYGPASTAINPTVLLPVESIAYFDIPGGVLTRGRFQYSTDGGANWVTMAHSTAVNFTNVSGKIFRFLDQLPADTTTQNSIGTAWDLVGDPNTTSSGVLIDPDLAPTAIATNPVQTRIFDDSPLNFVVAGLNPANTGTLLGGHWQIDSQSVPNLMSISHNNTVDDNALLRRGTGAMPAVGSVVSVTARYFDIYQTDNLGNPIAGQGFAQAFNFTVTQNATTDIAGLGSEFAVNAFTTNTQNQPAIARLSTGNFVVAWRSAGQDNDVNPNAGIYARIYNQSGVAQGAEFRISPLDNVTQSAPTVAGLSGGRFVVAYVHDSNDIRFHIVEANGTVGAVQLAHAASAAIEATPRVSLLNDGNFAIVWTNSDDVYARVFNGTTGAALAAEYVVNATLTGTQSVPDVAAIGGSNFVMVWRDPANSGDVLARTGNSAGPVSAEWVVAGGANNQSAPRVAGFAGGNFTVAFTDVGRDGDAAAEANVYLQRYSAANTTSGGQVRANATVTGSQLTPFLTAMSDGGVFVGWLITAQDLDGNGLFGRRFDSSGTAIDANDAQLNHRRQFNQSAGAMAAGGSGAAAIAWVDAQQDGLGTNNNGIEARVFNPVAAPNLTINDVSLSEGNAGITNFAFTVSLSAPAGPGGVTFDIATANGTATGGVDYVAQSLTSQTIPAGSSTYTFTVLVNGDLLNEPTETFFVNVTSAVNASVVDGQGVGTITNDDPLPSLSINDVSVVEGNSGTTNAVFTVTLNAASGQTVTVNYATANGTATQPADYTSTSGTLTFTPGQTTRTITVPVIGETVPEANETFFVNLSGATNATVSDNQGLGTITNDDVPVTVNPTTVPNGTVASAYSQSLTAGGGLPSYGFAVTAGALPAGLTLSPAGALSGTPTAGGTFNFTVTATDSSPSPGPFSGSQAYTMTIAPPTIVLPATALPGGTLGSPYSAAITAASGGTAPYLYTVTAGALPGGLTLNPVSGAITGTPSALGTFNFSVTAADSSTGTGPYTTTQSYAITVIDVPPVANAVSLTVAYNAPVTNVPLNVTGGAPTSLAIVTPPTHGTAIVGGTTITYQPTVGYAGPDSFTYSATNSGGTSAPATVTVTVQDPVITITPSGGFAATVAAPYTQTFTFNGGAQPWSSYQVTNLPAGITVTGTTANTVTVSGTPTQAGSFNLNVSAIDSSTGTGPYNIGQAFTLSVTGPTLTMTPAAGTLNAPYATAFSQTFTASGGIGPYTYVLTGTLPSGLSFSAGTIAGMPTVPGSYPITITATDSGSSGTGAPFSIAQNYTVDVPAPSIGVNPATLPDPVAANAYSQIITAAGGAAPYGFAVTTGSLPPGITLTGGGALSGTSNQVGAYNFTITATDNFGQTGSRPYAVTIAAPTLTLAPAAGTLNAPYATAFSQTFTASGGSGSFSYVVTGVLPAGLVFSGNTVSGTPTVPGSYPITVTVTDTVLTGAGAPFSIAQNYTIDVPAPSVGVNPATLPDPVAANAYSQIITAAGGAVPYGFAVTAGSLPPGITLANSGALSGTSNQVGAYNFTITATDNFGQTGSRPYAVTIAAPTLTLAPAAGTLNAPYAAAFSQTFTASGGSGNFSYVVTGVLPAGLAFSSNTVSGTPTAPGSYPITVTATDTVLTGTGAPFSIAQNYTIDVPAPTIVVNPATVSNGTAGAAYSQTLSGSGGVGPYAFAVSAGSLPTGVALSGAGALTGTPTSAGTFNFTVTATDANGQSGQRPYAVSIAVPTLTLLPATLPGGVNGTSYNQTFTASGGVAPYSYALTGGTLPTGLTLGSNGNLSGTPSQFGNFSITVTATDSTGGTAATISQNYALTISPVIVLSTAGVPGGIMGVPYTGLLSASGGAAPYSFAVTGGSLPPGLTMAANGAITGTPSNIGTWAFTVTMTDSLGFTGTAQVTIGVATPYTPVPATSPWMLLLLALMVLAVARSGLARTH